MKPLSRHQAAVRALSERLASTRAQWIRRNSYFYSSDHRYLRLLVPEDASVLEIGCGNGQLLAALKPRRGVGIDISESMIALARAEHPEYEFHVANTEDPAAYENITGPFDTIILADTVGYLEDCQAVFMLLRRLVTPRTRVIVAYYSHLWEPLLNAGERLGLKMPQDIEQSWLSTDDIMNLLVLSDYEVVGREWRVLLPRRLLGVGEVVNRFIAPLPGIRRLCLRNYVVARTRTHGAGRRRPFRRRPCSSLAATSAATSRARSSGCRGSAPTSRSSSSRAIAPTAPTRNACACGTPIRICDIKVLPPGRQGQGRRGAQGLRQCERRHPDDPRRRPDDAAGAAPQVLRGDGQRQGRVRQRHAPRLSDGIRSDAAAQLGRQPRFRRHLSQLSRQPALDRHAVRHQGAMAEATTSASSPTATISAISIRSAIST